MNGYQGRHRKHADPGELSELSEYMRGLADLIQIVPSKTDSE